jgi:hypothetical protein
MKPCPDLLVFTHFGRSDYLSRTLECATHTNPHVRRLLIGDDSNRDVAISAGWAHIHFDEIKSDLRTQFSEVFQRVQGSKHNPIKNGRDWLRYVFERWYIVAAYCRKEGIQHLWHFDSDVMVLEDLAPVEEYLKTHKIAFTRQCNNTCLNGFVSYPVLHQFCEYVVSLFRDHRLLQFQQLEFNTEHPGYAFTEMRAFEMYSRITEYKGCHLEQVMNGWWFDDCICQDDGFETKRLGIFGKPVKRVCFDGRRFYGYRAAGRIDFAAINCSWVPTEVFDWILARVYRRQQDPGPQAAEELAEVNLTISYGVRKLKTLAFSMLK